MALEQDKKQNNKDSIDTVVLYVGTAVCRNNNYAKLVGGAVHGYFGDSTSGNKNTNFSPSGTLATVKGYEIKGPESEASTLLKVHGFIDCLSTYQATIPETEVILTVVEKALRGATEYNPTKVVFMDIPLYIKKGVEEWHAHWERNNWRKQDGSPVLFANRWKSLLASINLLKDSGLVVEFITGTEKTLTEATTHVKTLANIAANRKAVDIHDCVKSEPRGYWKPLDEKPTLLCHKRMLFNSETPVGNRLHCLDPADDDLFIARKIPEASYSLVELNDTPDIVLNATKVQAANSHGLNALTVLKLDNLYTSAHLRYYKTYNDLTLVPASGHLVGLNSVLDELSITSELNPPAVAYRAIELFSILNEIMDDVNKPEEGGLFTYTDITDLLYSTDEKKKTRSLRQEYIVGYTKLPVVVKTAKGDKKISLSMGLDLPNRNILKRLEKEMLKAVVVVEDITERSFRYSTYIETTEGKAVYTNVFSNTQFV